MDLRKNTMDKIKKTFGSFSPNTHDNTNFKFDMQIANTKKYFLILSW